MGYFVNIPAANETDWEEKCIMVKTDIMHAFMELMGRKSYMDITVTDIINTAQVARASFYRNFSSTSDVLDAIADDMAREFLEDVYPALNGTDERKWREFLFQYFYRFMRNQKRMAPFSPQNAQVLHTRIDQRVQLNHESNPPESIRDKYSGCGKMGLIHSIARKWVDDGMEETPEEMIDFIMGFITTF